MVAVEVRHCTILVEVLRLMSKVMHERRQSLARTQKAKALVSKQEASDLMFPPLVVSHAVMSDDVLKVLLGRRYCKEFSERWWRLVGHEG